MTQADADALYLRKRLQRLIKIDASRRVDRRRGFLHLDLIDITRLARSPLQIQTRGDPLDPGGEGALAAKLSAPLKGGDEGVLGHVVGLGGLGAHAAQQGADRRPVPTNQFAELAPPTSRRLGGQLYVVSVSQGHRHVLPPSRPPISPCSC